MYFWVMPFMQQLAEAPAMLIKSVHQRPPIDTHYISLCSTKNAMTSTVGIHRSQLLLLLLLPVWHLHSLHTYFCRRKGERLRCPASKSTVEHI